LCTEITTSYSIYKDRYCTVVLYAGEGRQIIDTIHRYVFLYGDCVHPYASTESAITIGRSSRIH